MVGFLSHVIKILDKCGALRRVTEAALGAVPQIGLGEDGAASGSTRAAPLPLLRPWWEKRGHREPGAQEAGKEAASDAQALFSACDGCSPPTVFCPPPLNREGAPEKCHSDPRLHSL